MKKLSGEKYICRHSIHARTEEGARKVFPPGAEITAEDLEGGSISGEESLERMAARGSVILAAEWEELQNRRLFESGG